MENITEEEMRQADDFVRRYKFSKEQVGAKNSRKIRRAGYKTHFWKGFRDELKAIRMEEKGTFRKRHEMVSKEQKVFNKKKTDSSELSIKLGNGMAHLKEEFLFQLKRLSSMSERTFTGYVLANRKAIALLVAGGLTIGIAASNSNDPQPIELPTDYIESVLDANDQDYYTLTRMYEVQEGDTLSDIADDVVGCSVDDIIEDNDITNPDYLRTGQVIKLNYNVPAEDLKYYAKVIPTEDIEDGKVKGLEYMDNIDHYLFIDLTTIGAEDNALTDQATYELLNPVDENDDSINKDVIILPEFPTEEQVTYVKQYEKSHQIGQHL